MFAPETEVLGRYPLPSASVRLLGSHGGFSGARLWRVEAGSRSFCLRAWPPGDPSAERLCWLHSLMTTARGAGLPFVPQVMPVGEDTFTRHAGRLWELTTWLPGRADFREHPGPARLRAACVALGRLHLAWAPLAAIRGPCPALQRRLSRADEWLALVSSGWRPRPEGADPVAPWARPAWDLLSVWAPRVPSFLAPWADRPFALHPCLCDVWHDHILLEGDVVSGIVDYGSVKLDHAAVDLARLLGSLIGDDESGWDAGLAGYASVRPMSLEERALARALDRTGVILGAANWLMWLYREGRSFENRFIVVDRLAGLVQRMREWLV
jgi:Ser/Thr protein kinase RdoA (MazF antagonist)